MTRDIKITLTVYPIANDRNRWSGPMWNRYDRIIGAAIILAGRCVSLQWRSP